MLVIRLTRTGKKNASSFRIVLTEKKSAAKSGRFLEVLGSYNPRLKEITLKEERIKYWLSQGAKASDTVHNLLVNKGVIEGPKIAKKIKSKKDKGMTEGEQPVSEEKSVEEKKEDDKKEDKKEEDKKEDQPENEKK